LRSFFSENFVFDKLLFLFSVQLKKATKPTSEGSPHTRVPPSTTTPAVSTGTSFASTLPHTGLAGFGSIANIEAVKRAQELAANMGFHQDREFAPVINLFPGQAPSDMTVAQRPEKPPVLRVDALGREIDEHGNVISVTKPSNLSTLKVSNVNLNILSFHVFLYMIELLKYLDFTG
jgi:U4/U6 small nuclear ribonucleoprotein PRP3